MPRLGNDFDNSLLLTAVVGTVNDQLDKLYWNFQCYLRESREAKGRGTSVGWAAIDFCKASSAILDWMSARYIRAHRARTVQPVFDVAAGVKEQMAARVRWQNPLRAIANCAKHGRFDDTLWAGGTASLAMAISGNPSDIPIHPQKGIDLEQALAEGFCRYEVVLKTSIGGTHASDVFLENYIDWERMVTELGL